MRRQIADPVKARTRQMHATLKRRGGAMPLEEFRALYWEKVSAYTRCPYCFVFLTTRNVSLDHRVPVNRGGTHGRENLAFVCKGCNAAKGHRTDAEFADLMRVLDEWQVRHLNWKLRDEVVTALKVSNSFRIGANRRAKKP